ncbi:MAG: glycosyltransferase family 2 protein [Proteobacteria bacterium]|nr:glycosyltransferase family 2 protein [Pseudomonadota bacterium]
MSQNDPTVDPTPRLSIIAPCYNEAETIVEFHRRASESARGAVGDAYELIIVDDGSSDGSWALIQQLSGDGGRTVGVKLRRNYGHQAAVTAGLSLSSGRRVLLIDADLQDPPELLREMMGLMDGGAEVVYGKRLERERETVFKRASAAVFYRLLDRISSIDIPVDAGDFRLMDRRVVDLLLAMPEQHRFTRGLVTWIGGHQVPIEYNRDARYAGATKYSLRKMVRFAADAITAFSVQPLRIATWAGSLTACFALALLVYSLTQWARGLVVDGWTSLIIAVSGLSAVQLVVLGIIGEYLGRLVTESKHRPQYLIDAVQARGRETRLPSRAVDADAPWRQALLANYTAPAGPAASDQSTGSVASIRAIAG